MNAWKNQNQNDIFNAFLSVIFFSEIPVAMATAKASLARENARKISVKEVIIYLWIYSIFIMIFYCFVLRPFAPNALLPPGPYLLGHWRENFDFFRGITSSDRFSSKTSSRCGGREGLCDMKKYFIRSVYEMIVYLQENSSIRFVYSFFVKVYLISLSRELHSYG